MTELQPLGPEGIRARIEAIRGRMQPVQNPAMFAREMESAGMAGQIGDLGTGTSATAPFNPFGGGAQIQGGAPPQIRAMIEEAANNHNIDPDLLDALVQAESNYKPDAVSSKRAMGLTQLMPATARALGVQDPFDPAQNLNGGARYLSQMLRTHGSLEHALAAYNAGPGNVAKYGGIPPFAETQEYVRKVMGLYGAKKAGG